MRARSCPTSRPSISESCLEGTPHINGRRIFSSVDRLDGHQYAHLRGDLNHPSVSRQARSSVVQSGGAVAFHWMRILLPPEDSNSITHSSSCEWDCATSSTNAGLVAL